MLTILSAPAGWMLVLGFCCALVDWVAVSRGSKRLEYVFKPATLLAYLVAALLVGSSAGGSRLSGWFILALTFSLAGDIFLMLPAGRWFLPGLVVFLMGHVCYIVGFNPSLPPAIAVAPLGVAGILTAIVLPRIVRALRHSENASLVGPVIGYSVILTLMLASAWSTWFRPEWATSARLLASAGGTLFYASDLMLAWNEFVRPSKQVRMAVIVTYHVAQLALVLTVSTGL